MTESEWLVCEEPEAMLASLHRSAERRLILFGCACCRRHPSLFPSVCQAAIATAEDFADGKYDATQLESARLAVESAEPNLFWTADYPDARSRWVAWLTAFDTAAADEFSQQHALHSETFDDMFLALKARACRTLASVVERAGVATHAIESAFHAARLRDIFGNPFRPVALDPAWRTDTAVAIARQIYDSRDFSAMPILADAFQDANCDDEQVLTHCRAPEPHVRGCWVVDLVLGHS